MSAPVHYQTRVNRVLDHIEQHLADDLSLALLSAIGCFSPFHFHRIFQGITGETLNAHVRRVRLERAAQLLRNSPRKRITDVALEVGFAGTAEFSRAFKSHFGRPASDWDRRSPLEKSKIGKAPDLLPFHTVEELKEWKSSKNVRIRRQQYEEFRFVYSRVFASYGNNQLIENYGALLAWLASRGTSVEDVVVIGMSQDDPSITPAEHYRYDVGIAFPREGRGILSRILDSRPRRFKRRPAAVPDRAECESRGLTIRDFAAQEVVGIHCSGDIGHVGRAWQYLYRIWLPEHACDPVDLPAMELFVRLPEEIGWETFDLHACIPVNCS